MKKFPTRKATLALLIILMAVGLLASCTKANSQGANSSTPGTTHPTAETTEAPTTIATNPTEESIAEPTIEATENTEPTQSREPTSTNKQNSSTEKPTPSDDNTTTPTTSSKPATSTATGVANTKKGVSWDGKSPIVYTYADGTTGTKPMDGATYESMPGVITTYKEYTFSFEDTGNKDEIVTFHCDYCGKEDGDGTKGTCLRWFSGGDHTCPNCNATVPSNTCHTCKED